MSIISLFARIRPLGYFVFNLVALMEPITAPVWLGPPHDRPVVHEPETVLRADVVHPGGRSCKLRDECVGLVTVWDCLPPVRLAKSLLSRHSPQPPSRFPLRCIHVRGTWTLLQILSLFLGFYPLRRRRQPLVASRGPQLALVLAAVIRSGR
jgi:hypothetical protein